MMRQMLIVGLVLGLLPLGSWAEVTPDDAVIAALDAEIEQVDKQATDTVDSDEPSEAEAQSAVAEQSTPRVRPSSVSRPSAAKLQKLKNARVVVTTVPGRGETPEAAKLDAFRKAVEHVVGIWVDAESIMENNALLKDRVNTISNADIRKYETLKEDKLKSGMYGIKIKAWVEKKAIAPKFADIFPAAFANVGEEAAAIHVQKVTKAKRTSDAAALMSAEMDGVDRMRNWVRLSVAKGKGLDQVTKISQYRASDIDVAEIPGKGLYAVRYAMKVDAKAYFEGFVPHFKEVLGKMQEGEAAEDQVLESRTAADAAGINSSRCESISEDNDGRKLMRTSVGSTSRLDLQPFCSNVRNDGFYFVNPIVISGFPGLGTRNLRRPEHFMFDGSLAKTQEERTYNIWLMDRMNHDGTSVRCSAYKIPTAALRVYWKGLYGDLNSTYAIPKDGTTKVIAQYLLRRNYAKVEVALFDADGMEIASTVDTVPVAFLTWGGVWDESDLQVERGHGGGRAIKNAWDNANVFNSFFIRPMFYSRSDKIYATEVQRDVYFPLADAQLEKVKTVKVSFVGGKTQKNKIRR